MPLSLDYYSVNLGKTWSLAFHKLRIEYANSCSLNSEKSPPSLTFPRWQHQKRGGNGGVTITGTVGSILGGTVIAIAYYITLLMLLTICRILAVLPQWLIILIGCLGGFLGTAFEQLSKWQFQILYCLK